MEHNEKMELVKSRDNQIVKHNDLVQKSRFELSLVEQKTINFLISLIPQNATIKDLEYEFKLQDYCKICGIDYNQGKNYKTVRDTLRELCKKDAIMTLPDGTDTRVTWINKFWSNKGKGWAKIRFDEDLAPYLFELSKNTTRFELLNILPMKSKYSIRIYELCRSWASLKSHTYRLEELRSLLMVPENELINFKDFRRRVLEVAQKEINEYTDLRVYFEPITKGRKVVQIRFHISKKETMDRLESHFKVNQSLDKENNTQKESFKFDE